VQKTDSRQFSNALIAQLPALRRYAAALAGSVSAGDDLVQDCLERALKQADSLRDPGRLAAWLRSILYNLYVDELRRRRARGIEEDISALVDSSALSVPPRDRGEFSDLTAAMSSLSAEHRQILLLVGLDGMSYREIADELGVPIGTVMSRLARARERLRSLLEGEPVHDTPNVESLSARRRLRQ
jgi:RNA polymerase sigma-70 factor (ECF subfamily)